MEPKEKDQLLTLKVMRLTRPSITTLTTLMSSDEKADVISDSFLINQQTELSLLPRFPQSALTSDFLTLPQNFGTIYLGESFMGYINVHNHSESACSDVLIKVELQTGSQKLLLSGGGDPTIPLIAPDASIDQVIRHEIKELGTHILVCSVSYLPPDGERNNFRKFFKFHVYKPLDVKTKFYNIKSEEVYLEAQLQNITLSPIFLETVNLDPGPNFSVQEIHSDVNGSPFEPSRLMNPQDIRQFLFRLSCEETILSEGGLSNVGKLDIVWFVNGGEKGRLQTSQLQRNPPVKEDLSVIVERNNDESRSREDDKFSCKVGAEYVLPISITNNTNRSMELKLNLLNPGSSVRDFVWSGVCEQVLGTVNAQGKLKATLGLKPLVVGLVKISGLQVIDIFLKRIYNFDDVIQIFVTS